MALISSIFKSIFLSVFGVALLVGITICATGCADKKVKPFIDIDRNNSQEIASYSMEPQQVGDIFVDKTKEYGLAGVKGVHLYAVDANDDGATDLVVLDDFQASPQFYFFDKKSKQFKLGKNPFNEIIRASYLVFVDLDHDGILDVIVGNLNQKSEMIQYPASLYRGIADNGKLIYQKKAELPTGVLPTASIVPFDFNLDGEIDLFFANWFSQNGAGPKPVPDILLKGKGFEFENMSELLTGELDYDKNTKTYLNATPTFGASICDVDKNGFPDVITSNSNGYYNKMWLNMDAQSFVDYGLISEYSADNEGMAEAKQGGNAFFSLCGDYNNDGIVDIVIGNLSKESDPEFRDRSAVLTGASKTFPPKFIRSEFYQSDKQLDKQSGKQEQSSESNRRGVWIDYNLDGKIDLLVENSGFPPHSRLIFFEQAHDHEFVDVGKKLGVDLMNPSGVVTIDLNNDGVMDFISGQSKVRAGEIDTRLYVFENQTPRKGRGSIRFHLQARIGNSQGVSSNIELRTDKQKYFSSALYTYGSLPSQNEEGVYFAFGHEIPKEVEVRWSLGGEDRLGRIMPLTKKYDLSRLVSKARHLELNLCEDGRILSRPKNCY